MSCKITKHMRHCQCLPVKYRLLFCRWDLLTLACVCENDNVFHNTDVVVDRTQAWAQSERRGACIWVLQAWWVIVKGLTCSWFWTFRVHQAWWVIVKGLTRSWLWTIVSNIMYACIIMHTMIVEEEGENIIVWQDDSIASNSTVVTDSLTQCALQNSMS